MSISEWSGINQPFQLFNNIFGNISCDSATIRFTLGRCAVPLTCFIFFKIPSSGLLFLQPFPSRPYSNVGTNLLIMFLKMFFLDLNGTSNIIMPYLLFKNGLMFFLDLNGTSNIIMPYLLFKNGLMFFLDLNGTSNIIMPYLLFKNGLSDFRFDVQYTGSKIKVMKIIETIITLSTVERKHAFLV